MLFGTLHIVDLFKWLLLFLSFEYFFEIAENPFLLLFFISWACLAFLDNWLLIILTLMTYEHSIIIELIGRDLIRYQHLFPNFAFLLDHFF